jgi:hypothetical protein
MIYHFFSSFADAESRKDPVGYFGYGSPPVGLTERGVRGFEIKRRNVASRSFFQRVDRAGHKSCRFSDSRRLPCV